MPTNFPGVLTSPAELVTARRKAKRGSGDSTRTSRRNGKHTHKQIRMSCAALLLLVAGTVVGAPPLAVEPPLVADFDEWEVYQAHSVVQAAKDAKRDLDAMRKAHDVALSDIDAMRLAIEHDGAHLNDLQTCLLYTSPSPRDQRGSRMPSSA